MRDKKFVILAGIFFMLFVAGISALTLNEPVTKYLRASNVNISATNSFIIAFPQKGIAGTEKSTPPGTKIKVSVYVRDTETRGQENRIVKLATDVTGIQILPSDTQTTDKLGMAVFYVLSPNPGIVKVTAVDVKSSTSITKGPNIEFTK